MGMIAQQGNMSIKVSEEINIINSFTNMFWRKVLFNPIWSLHKKGYCEVFSEKPTVHSVFLASLRNRLRYLESWISLCEKKILILNKYIMFSATSYSVIGLGIHENAILWAVHNACMLFLVECHHLDVFGLL